MAAPPPAAPTEAQITPCARAQGERRGRACITARASPEVAGVADLSGTLGETAQLSRLADLGRHQFCQWAERLTAVMALRAGCCHGDPSTLALAQANSALWTSCLAYGFEHPFVFVFLWSLGFRHGTVDQQSGQIPESSATNYASKSLNHEFMIHHSRNLK